MLYRDIHASLLRFCMDTSDQWFENVPQFVNFDSAADEELLPKADLIGPLALSIMLDDHLINGTVQIGYSSWADTNLFRLVERMDALLELLKPTCQIPLYDATGAAGVKGLLVVENGTRLMPVVVGKTRPVQFIGINFSSTLTFTL